MSPLAWRRARRDQLFAPPQELPQLSGSEVLSSDAETSSFCQEGMEEDEGMAAEADAAGLEVLPEELAAEPPLMET